MRDLGEVWIPAERCVAAVFGVECVDCRVADKRAWIGHIDIGGIVRPAVFNKLGVDVVGIGFADEEAGGVALVDWRKAVELREVEVFGDPRQRRPGGRALAGGGKIVLGFRVDFGRCVVGDAEWRQVAVEVRDDSLQLVE